MKTMLFSPMYLNDGRFNRHIKWMEKIPAKLERSIIYFVDNKSEPKLLNDFQLKYPEVEIEKCKLFLDRKTQHAYGYWYRAFRNALIDAQIRGCDKLIHIDTDLYLLSNKIVEYVNAVNKGWTGFWCPKYDFPETAFQIICKDQFQNALEFFTDGFLETYPTREAEKIVPFTYIEKGFMGDRYGEDDRLQEPWMDYYAQCPDHIYLKFQG